MPENEHELKAIRTGAVEWRVLVDDKGRFYADSPGFTQVTGDSYEELERTCKVRASQKRVKVEVPFVTPGPSGRLRHRVATGIHASNFNVLYHGTGAGDSGQLDRYGGGSHMRPFSAEDEARWGELVTEINKLESERRALTSKYAFPQNLAKSVREAVDAAAAALRERETAGPDTEQ